MFYLCLLLGVVGLCQAGAIRTGEEDVIWQMFKQRFDKKYAPEIDAIRKIVFSNNLHYIQQHNVETDLGRHSYWLGVNSYTDWSNDEFVKFMNGYKKRSTNVSANRVTRASTFLAPENLEDLPEKMDWRRKGYVTPVKNQEQCGSCWAFSTTGSLEGQHFRKTGRLVSISEQNLVDCSRAEGNEGCNGGLMDQAFEYIEKRHGIDTEKCYPYTATDNNCTFHPNCVGATVTGYKDISSGDENALKIAVATVGPISVAIDASHPSFQVYRNGVYDEPECSQNQLDHAVLVVGYGTDVDTGKDYWLVKNSWGKSWGKRGYIKMVRNMNNNCGIATQASYPMV